MKSSSLPLLFFEKKEKALFGECFLRQLDIKEIQLKKVRHNESNGKFVLNRMDDGNFLLSGDGEAEIPLFHHQDCPCLTEESCTRDVRVAVCVLIEYEGKILLTRRNPKMNTFNNVWVVPGGHVDPTEQLKQAAVREVLEETNLVIAEEQLVDFCFYESVFPVEQGSPTTRHHLVEYFHAVIDDVSRLKLNWDECDAYFWITKELVEKMFDETRVEQNKVEKFSYYMHDGEEREGYVADLKGVIEEDGKYRSNRISTGTQYCLKRRFCK